MTKRKAVSPRRIPRPRASATVPEKTPVRRYIESSALVAAVLESDAAARKSIRAAGQRITSALTITEAGRAILRARLAGRITVQQQRAALLTLLRFARRCHIVGVTEAILVRAGNPFPVEPVRTLEALHLATVEALGHPPVLVTIVTRDTRVRNNAAALGHPVE